MKVLDLERQWLDNNTELHEVDLKVTLKVVNEDWHDFEEFLSKIKETASRYGYDLSEY